MCGADLFLLLLLYFFTFIVFRVQEYTSVGSMEKIPSLRRSSVPHRKNKVSLWSAVALQQHFSLLGSLPSQEISTNALPPPLPHGRLTLAQKMGLVPSPPLQPSFDEWKQIEEVAANRTNAKNVNETSRCCICFEPLYLTLNQGQIILSCSHVFHELCFTKFEKLTRRLQVSEGNYFCFPLACPECRQTHYHKKVFYAGKALAQRCAIIKIQSAFRGFLARRKYLKLKLSENVKFRDAYIKEKLQKLSRAWEAYLEYRESERGRVIANVEAKKQEALATYLSEKDWNEIIEKRIEKDKVSQRQRENGYFVGSRTSHEEEFNVCPICMEIMMRQVRLYNSIQIKGLSDEKMTYGEAVVEGFRHEYEEKKKRKELEGKANTRKVESIKKPLRNARVRNRTKGKERRSDAPDQGGKKVNFLFDRSTTTTSTASHALAPLSTFFDGPCYQVRGSQATNSRANVILSCGHCFHKTCLETFERYCQWRAKEGAFPPVKCCPVCRSGYVAHPF